MTRDRVPFDARRQWLDVATPVTSDPRRVPSPPGPSYGDAVIVLRGGRVFTATGQPPSEGTVVVKGCRIAAVLPRDGPNVPNPWPDDAVVYDVPGMTVMPGLIDLHTHLTYTEPGLAVDTAQSQGDATLRALERLRFFAESGITSVRDAASAQDIPFRIKAWVAEHRLPLPRVFACGRLITATGGHGAEGLSPVSPAIRDIREASGPDDWREAVREQFKIGADVIKVASHYSPDELAAAVDEAHTLGLKVMCDAETLYIDWAVAAGVDTIEHPLPRSDGAIQTMAERGIQAVPTLIPYEIIFDLYGGYFGSTSRRFTFSKEANLDVVRRMRLAGVTIGVGTDLVMDWFRYLPGAYIKELKLLMQAGLDNAEALEAATRVNAEILDMGHALGTIEPGKLADILVIAGRPDQCLDDLRQVRLVIRDGQPIVRDGLGHTPRHEEVPLPSPTGEVKGPWY